VVEREPYVRNAGGSARSAPSEGYLGKHRKEGRLRTFALGLPSRRVLLLLEEEGS
jgi:hypothetical protein